MAKITLKKRLKDYLAKKNEFVNAGELERLAMSVGYKGSTASRELRLMSEGINPEILRDDNRDKKHTVWYMTTKPMVREQIRIVDTGEIITRWVLK